ncbi:MAG: DUF5675 family protein, partial [Cyclobacteriaceae bacterium]
ELFTGADLTSYFNPDHMDFSGITRAAFKRSGQLPEGFYTFTLEVLEYNRNVRVSNHSVSYAWIVLNDPPLLNTPFNGDKLITTDPQNIMFSWTPRHTASPSAAFSTEYEFRLVELYPGQTNPDIAIRSSNSIYTTTTTLTSLNYGIIEPTLIPGKKYAFRVRAYDTSGRDLFKNDGYSETYVFQYGDACGIFEGIAAKTLDPQRARISWEPEQHHTGCVINYRKNGKEDWFTQEVNGSYGIVAQLAGRTTYEYQLIPQCGTILGEKSPVLTFTTPEVDESGFVCGAPIPEFDASDVPLMKPLLPLDVIQVGDWTVNLLNVSANGDGTYGGAGYAAVPNFNLANVRVLFDRILVNEDYQVVAGDIKTVYSEDSRFVLDIQKKEEEPEVVEGPEDANPELTEDLVADVLAVEIPADIGEVVFSGGLLEVYDESGNLIEDTDLDLPPEGEELTITDSNGDTWVVDSEGVVKEGHVGEASTPESSEVDVIVQFKPTEESSYGFDAYDPDIPQLRHFYQNILTINDEEYVPAWKSVPVGMPDQVIAMAGENEFPENMKFRSSTVDLEPMAGQQDNEKNLSVIGKAHGDVDVIEAYQSIEDEEQVAGRIHVISYEKIYKTLEIVPVNGASIGDIHTIGDRINKIFQQAAVEWKVEAAEPFMVDPKLLENFDEGESGMLASFPDKMQRFNREFKRSRPVDKETYYIFIIDEGNASLSGFMPFKRQFGYVFTKNTSYTNKTIAHELAHGAFRLRHTFSSAYGIPQRSTDNLMDYNGDLDRLKKFQWDLIHDPENLVGWFEDDEESAMDICFWTKSLLTYNSIWGKDHVLTPYMSIYNEVKNNFDEYWDKSEELFEKYQFGNDKENNLALTANSNWTIRNASHYKKADSTYFVDLAIKKIVSQKPGVILHSEGVTLARITLKGKDYRLAAYSLKGTTDPNYVRVKELCDLVENESIQVYNDRGHSFIAFLNNEVPELVIQVITEDEDDIEIWLEYFGILVEDERNWLSIIPPFWENWTWDIDVKDIIKIKNTNVFDHFISDKNAWYRDSIAPYKLIPPEPKSNILKKGLQVALLEIFEDEKKNKVAKIKIKESQEIQYTSLSNLTQVKSLTKDRIYKFNQDYKPLNLPFPTIDLNKTYKVGDEVIIDKFYEDYLKVKGIGEDIEGHWIHKSVVFGENRIIVRVERMKHNDKRTVGTISVDNGKKTGYTLELPKGTDNECKSECTDSKKMNNKCHRVIKGTYVFSITSWSENANFIDKSLRLDNVPGRNGILIHRGVNARIWSKGCILMMRNDPVNDKDDAIAKDRSNTVSDSEAFCIEIVESYFSR